MTYNMFGGTLNLAQSINSDFQNEAELSGNEDLMKNVHNSYVGFTNSDSVSIVRVK